MNGKIIGVYFSPTNTTQKITRTVAAAIAERTGTQHEEINWTMSDGRGGAHSFRTEDVLIFGFPVYGGRVPKFLASELAKLQGQNTKAVILAVYGNRDYDDALLEAKDILTSQGFSVIAAGAFIGEHSHSFKLAAGRPDENDLAEASQFARQVVDKIAAENTSDIAVKGKTPYKEHMPDMPFLPKTKDSCTGCKLCASVCPMGIISEDNPKEVKPICITCHACVKSCPMEAKFFDAEPMERVVAMLESKCMEPKAPELFI